MFIGYENKNSKNIESVKNNNKNIEELMMDLNIPQDKNGSISSRLFRKTK